MINAIPVIGWALSLFFAASLAVPFWFIWTVCGIGATYAYWLPAVYLAPGFWICVGLFIVASIIKRVFVPTIVSVSQSADKSA
jgi:hypothetical protein